MWPCRGLLLEGLGRAVEASMVREELMKYGSIDEFKLFYGDGATRGSTAGAGAPHLGLAFVSYVDWAAAQRAMAALNGKLALGGKLRITYDPLGDLSKHRAALASKAPPPPADFYPHASPSPPASTYSKPNLSLSGSGGGRGHAQSPMQFQYKHAGPHNAHPGGYHYHGFRGNYNRRESPAPPFAPSPEHAALDAKTDSSHAAMETTHQPPVIHQPPMHPVQHPTPYGWGFYGQWPGYDWRGYPMGWGQPAWNGALPPPMPPQPLPPQALPPQPQQPPPPPQLQDNGVKPHDDSKQTTPPPPPPPSISPAQEPQKLQPELDSQKSTPGTLHVCTAQHTDLNMR